MEYFNGISCAILAGGQSRRFGKDKTLEKLNGKSLTEILANKLLEVSDDVMIISKNSEKFDFKNDKIRFLTDFTKKQSPLAGIITALKNARNNKVFVISADTPFLKPALISFLAKYSDDYDIVLTVVNEKINTLCGLYNVKVADSFKKGFDAGKYKILDNFENFNVMYIDDISEIKKFDPELLSFININTKEDFEYAKRITEKFGI